MHLKKVKTCKGYEAKVTDTALRQLMQVLREARDLVYEMEEEYIRKNIAEEKRSSEWESYFALIHYDSSCLG